MENFKYNPIWQVLYCVENGYQTEAIDKCEAALLECDEIAKTINLQSNKAIDFLKNFISAVQRNQPVAAQKQLKTATDIFNKEIIPHYQREEEAQKKKGPQNKGNSRSEHQQPERTAKNREDFNTVVERFRNIYDEAWLHAHDELYQQRKNLSEKEKAGLLLEILQRAFSFSKEEAEGQLREAEICAKHIVKYGELPQRSIKGSPPAVPHELLRRYRYLNAHLSESRLKKNFRDTKLKSFYEKHALKRSPAFDEYATSCVDVAWLLCTEDPPVHMVVGKESDRFDEGMYTYCTRKGKQIDYVVWPALQHYENGPIVAKGLAESKN